MRIDRHLTTAIFHPLQRAGLGARGFRLPILMYHSISVDPQTAVCPYYRTHTHPDVFGRQLRLLAAEGYKTIKLADVIHWLAGGPTPPPKSVVITFDDGFSDFYLHAFPSLQELGFTATVFVPTGFIADPRRRWEDAEFLTWAEIRQMRKAGIEFGSHTVNHAELVKLPLPEVERELVQSKAELEQQLAEPALNFAYPYAFPQCNAPFARNLRALLIKAGYACCLTTEIGRVKSDDDPFRLKRLPINSLDDTPLLRAKLEGGYDWLGVPQRAFKLLKGSGQKTPSASRQ
jgi:peptidoglycan/xylan/chitin deacetylase (PgdA/CDA1 family)